MEILFSYLNILSFSIAAETDCFLKYEVSVILFAQPHVRFYFRGPMSPIVLFCSPLHLSLGRPCFNQQNVAKITMWQIQAQALGLEASTFNFL